MSPGLALSLELQAQEIACSVQTANLRLRPNLKLLNIAMMPDWSQAVRRAIPLCSGSVTARVRAFVVFHVPFAKVDSGMKGASGNPFTTYHVSSALQMVSMRRPSVSWRPVEGMGP